MGTLWSQATSVQLTLCTVRFSDAIEDTRVSPKMSAFIDSIILARTEAADDAGALAECATALQQHNRDLKQHIAKLDAEAVKEATAGWGTNDQKLIVSLCSRTKSQLHRCATSKASRPQPSAHNH